MGCGSQSGCLGPKPRERQVYLDLIQTIYTQSQKIQIPEYIQPQQRNEDPYMHVKTILTKKGQCKKLIDNLNSHKGNLYECSNQILQITVRSNNLPEHTASLVLVDRIIQQFFKEEVQTKLEIKHSKSLSKGTSVDQILPTLVRTTLNMQLPIDIQQRVNLVYFKIVIVLIQKEPLLYKDILASLQVFLTLKADRLNCKNQIFRLFELLIDKVKHNHQVQKTNLTFSYLLNRVKQNFCNEINKDYTSFFVRHWFYQQDKQKSQVTNSFKMVLEEFISRSFGSTQSLVLSFVKVLDEVSFEAKGAKKIEELLLGNIEFSQTGRQIIRSLVIFLLKYLQMGGENCDIDHHKFKNAEEPTCKLQAFRLLTRWILEKYVNINSIIQYNPSALVNSYLVNIEKAHSNAFQSELKVEYMKIIQSVNQQSTVVISSWLAEEMKQKTVRKQRREILFSLLQDIFKKKSSIFTNEEYCTSIKFIINLEKHYPKELKQEILTCNVRNLKALNILKIKSMPESNLNFRSKICQFLHSIFCIISGAFEIDDTFSDKTISSNNQVSFKTNKIINLYRFLTEVNKIIKVMNELHLQGYLLCFVHSVNCYLRNLYPQSNQKDGVLLFFFTYLIQSILLVMNKKQRISESIMKIINKLEKEPSNREIRVQIIDTATALLKIQGSKMMAEQLDSTGSLRRHGTGMDIFKQRNEQKIVKTCDLFMIKQFQKQEITETFKEYFGQLGLQSKLQLEIKALPQIQFDRHPSIIEENNHERFSSKNEEEESFDQILGKIREE